MTLPPNHSSADGPASPRPEGPRGTIEAAAAAFEAAAVAIATLDASGRIVVANAACAALLGAAADALPGRRWPDDFADALAAADPARPAPATSAGPGEAAFALRGASGGGTGGPPRVVAAVVTPLAPGLRCLVLRDASDRRRDDAAMRGPGDRREGSPAGEARTRRDEHERQQFKFMADLASDAYFLVDDRSTIVYANRIAHAERGYAFGELVGVPVDAVSPSYDATRVQRLFGEMASGAVHRLSHQHRRKDGSTFPVESSVNYLTLDGRRYLFSAVRDVTAQREAEAAIRRERERMALVVKQANVGIWYAPVPLGELIWDDKVKEHFFLPPDARVTLDDCFAGMHPDDQEPTRAVFERSLADGSPYDVVYRTVAPDGSGRMRSIRAIGRCHFDEHGAPVQVDGITIDVTREVRDAAALRESENRFRAMANHAPVMVWVTGPDGMCTFLNDRWYAFTGQSEAEGLGLGWADATHPDDVERARDAFLAANAARAPFEVEYRLRRRDGAYRWCIDSAAPRFGGDGAFLGYIGSVIDITDRKLAEERLRDSEQRLQLAVAIAQLGTFEVELDSDRVRVNDVGRTIYGWPPDRALTFAFVRSCFHPDDHDRVVATIGAAIAPGGSGRFDVEQRIVRPAPAGGSEVRWVRVRGVGVFGDGPDRPATRIVGTYLDVTAQKEADDRRERLIAAEHSARVDAETAARLKDEFLTTLSHELRTPLNAILGWATLLRRADRSKDPNLARGLETIERNARVQAQLIADLLDVRHLMSGNLRIEPGDADLAAAVRAAADSLRVAAQAKGLRLELVDADAPAPMRGDGARLQQVAWHLLSNAVKFTPAGGSVVAAVFRPDPGRLELRVSDTGQGIDAGFLPHVFDRFRMADASTTRRHGGLGLGLAIVKQLVELHGGTVTASSDGLDRGATFVVTLPVDAPAVDAPTA